MDPDFVGGGAFGFDARVRIGDEFGEFSGGGAVVEAVEVGVFLQGDVAGLTWGQESCEITLLKKI